MTRSQDPEEQAIRVPLSYVIAASREGLENFEMNRRDHAANLEKEIKLLRWEQRRAEAEADVARWLIENREDMLRTVGAHLERVNDSRVVPVADFKRGAA